MSKRQPRWELVRTTAGWHARFRSSNGNVIVSSESYERRRDAVRAVALVGDAPSYSNGRDDELIEVRDVDERPAKSLLHHCTAGPQWLSKTVDEKCCTCCTDDNGDQPGRASGGDW